MARRKRTRTSSGLSTFAMLILIVVGLWAYYNRGNNNGPDEKPTFDFAGEIDLPEKPGIIRIATFNIQVLGKSKLSDKKNAAMLARIIRQFDVVAVQELRSKEQNIIPELLEYINQDGAEYESLVSERLGRTVSKEQYVYLFNTRRVQVYDTPNPFVWDDPADHFHRSPYLARFRCVGVDLQETFTFTLVNIHTDPDEAQEEVDALAVIPKLLRERYIEDDIIILGDFNRNSRQLEKSALAELPDIRWILTKDTPTNTKGTEQYDNIVFNATRTREFTGDIGVYNFRERFELSQDQADDLSDHLPVWGEFEIRERLRN